MQTKYMYNTKVYPKPEFSTRKQNLSQCNKIREIIMVNGDSHIKRIKWNLINNSFETEKSYVKLPRKSSRPQALRYPVTRRPKKRYCCNSNRWKQYYNFTNAENVNVDTLTENLGNIGKQCNKNGVCNVVISKNQVKKSIKLRAITRQVNDKTGDLCNTYEFYFIFQ